MDALMGIFFRMAELGIWTGAAVLLVLVCRQLFLKKQPKSICCALWLLVFLRLLCPVTVKLPLPKVQWEAAESLQEEWRQLLREGIGQEKNNGGAQSAGLTLEGSVKSADDGAAQEAAASRTDWTDSVSGKAGQTNGGQQQTGSGLQIDGGQQQTGSGLQIDGGQQQTGSGLQIDGGRQQTGSKLQSGNALAAGRGELSLAQQDAGAVAEFEALSAKGTFAKVSAWAGAISFAGRQRLLQAAALIWLAGAAVLLGAAALRYFSLKRRLRQAVLCDFRGQRVWETDQIKSPFVMGFFRPEIYLPLGLSEQEKLHIVAHEKSHVERCDHLLKPLCYLGAVCHWMNPLAWAAFYFYNLDMEMACDERTLKRFSRKERLDYSRTLLLTAVKGSGIELPVFFGESNTKRRVENILQKKKRTVKGACLAAVLVCVVAVVLLAYSGGEEHSRENAADAPGAEAVSTAREAETDEADTAFGAEPDGTDPAVEVEACAFVENGQLKVMLYNLSGWDHMYVNQEDFRVERQNQDRWEIVEPDESVNRIAGTTFYQLDYPRELGGLLSRYEEKLEDGEYRLVLYCQDTPVEDPQTGSTEIYAPFIWKDGAPAESADMLERMDELQTRYRERKFPWLLTFYYEEEPATDEEAIRRREEQNRAIREGDEAHLKLYEEKLAVIEQRMETVPAEQKEDYAAFCQKLLVEMAALEESMDSLEDVWIDGENITQTRLECEERLKETEEELTNVENYYLVRKSLQDNLLEEIGQAKGDNAQELTDYYNRKQEFIQQLLELQIKLQEEIKTLNQEAAKCRIMEKMGYDLIEEQKQRLEKLPADLNAQTAGQYGIPVIGMESGSEEVRDLLYQFWLETNGDGSLSETLSAERLESQRIALEKENPEAETVYRTVKSMTVTFGTETEENGLLLTSVTAWGNGYLILVDESRDTQSAGDAEPVSVHCYDRLYWLSSEDGTFENVVGSDEAQLTFEQLMESMLSSTWDGKTDRWTVAMFVR